MKFVYTIVMALAFLNTLVLACPDEKNCLQCSAPKEGEDRVCKNCENTFWNPDKKACESNDATKIENCVAFKLSNEKKAYCSQCALGYLVNFKTNTCDKCSVENCAICKGEVCYGCFNKMGLDRDNNKCISEPKCSVENCDQCVGNSGKDECAQCSSGWSLNNNSGVCIKGPSNCWQVADEKATDCQVCNHGYYIAADGTCKSNEGGRSWWLWLVLILIVLGVVGFFVYNHFQKNADDRDNYMAA